MSFIIMSPRFRYCHNKTRGETIRFFARASFLCGRQCSTREDFIFGFFRRLFFLSLLDLYMKLKFGRWTTLMSRILASGSVLPSGPGNGERD